MLPLPHTQEGGGVPRPPGALTQRMDRRQVQRRETQEGFLEEGSPPLRFEEHTVQTGAEASSRL